MKLLVYSFVSVCLLLFSCSTEFSAGSFPYAEDIYLNCERDSLINNLKKIKASHLYDNPYHFMDGTRESTPSYFYFYFLSRENNCVVLLAVGPKYDNTPEALLVSAKDIDKNSEWKLFNHDLNKERQRKIMEWFNNKIKPLITCN